MKVPWQVSAASLWLHGPIQKTLRPGYAWRRGTRNQAATTIGRSNTPLGAFYRRLSARAGKAKAMTATARKIVVLFYSLRYGMAYHEPGPTRYNERYRSQLLGNLQRRAKAFGFALHVMPTKPDLSVSLEAYETGRLRRPPDQMVDAKKNAANLYDNSSDSLTISLFKSAALV